jgi:hypothetical protein
MECPLTDFTVFGYRIGLPCYYNVIRGEWIVFMLYILE